MSGRGRVEQWTLELQADIAHKVRQGIDSLLGTSRLRSLAFQEGELRPILLPHFLTSSESTDATSLLLSSQTLSSPGFPS